MANVHIKPIGLLDMLYFKSKKVKRDSIIDATAVKELKADYESNIKAHARHQGNQEFVGMKARVTVAEVFHLQMLNRLYNRLRNKFGALPDTGNSLHGIDQAGRSRAEQIGRLAGDDPSVIELNCYGGTSGFFRALERCNGNFSVCRRYAG